MEVFVFSFFILFSIFFMNPILNYKFSIFSLFILFDQMMKRSNKKKRFFVYSMNKQYSNKQELIP